MIDEELKQLQYAVEHETNLPFLFEKIRSRELTDARCLFNKYAYEHLGRTWTQIARYSDQHHATIIYSVNKFNNLYSYDKVFKRQWDELLNSKSITHSSLNKYNRYQRLDKILESIKMCENDLNLVFEDLKQCIIKRKEAKALQT